MKLKLLAGLPSVTRFRCSQSTVAATSTVTRVMKAATDRSGGMRSTLSDVACVLQESTFIRCKAQRKMGFLPFTRL